MALVLNSKTTGNDDLALGYNLPSMRGVEAIHFLNGSLAKAAHNFALGKPDAQIVGSPTVGNGFIGVKGGANFLQTVIPETVEQTFMAVFRTSATLADDANRPALIGNYKGPMTTDPTKTTNGAQMFALSSTQVGMWRPRVDGVGGVVNDFSQATSMPVATFKLFVGRVDATRVSIRCLSDGAAGGQTGLAARALNSASHRIGSATERYLGSADMAFASIASVWWSDDEMLANARQLAAYLSTRFGLTGLVA